jgi:hypothetical protein
MRKTARKNLVLNRETVRILSEDSLRRVAAGMEKPPEESEAGACSSDVCASTTCWSYSCLR